MLKRTDEWNVRVFYAAMIVLMLGLFVWFAGNKILEASPFLMGGIAYAVLLFRVVSQSVRAFIVMQWACLLNFYLLISLDREGVLAIPAAGPWFIGFIVGGIAGGYVWLGPRAGSTFQQKHKRLPNADRGFSGGSRLALINGVCACVLLSIGASQVVLLSPTAPAVTVLVLAVAAGWALFRFPPSLQIRNGLVILGLPVVWFTLAFVGGATDQMALPHAAAYGVLAGVLVGGRYWRGPRLGVPRPPFSAVGRKRVRRKRRPKQQAQAVKRETPAVGGPGE